MNQQRARRFKAAREASERLEGAKKLRAEYEKQVSQLLFLIRLHLLTGFELMFFIFDV
jgi:5'-3' exonuclease